MSKRLPSVLIVDRYHKWGDRVRDQLSRQGCYVHVVCTSHAALAFARSKPIEAAVLEQDVDPLTGLLCVELQRLGVQAFHNHTDPELNRVGIAGSKH